MLIASVLISNSYCTGGFLKQGGVDNSNTTWHIAQEGTQPAKTATPGHESLTGRLDGLKSHLAWVQGAEAMSEERDEYMQLLPLCFLGVAHSLSLKHSNILLLSETSEDVHLGSCKICDLRNRVLVRVLQI